MNQLTEAEVAGIEAIRVAHSEASHRALEEGGKPGDPRFLAAYRKAMQEIVADGIIRKGGSHDDVDEFWGNEMQ